MPVSKTETAAFPYHPAHYNIAAPANMPLSEYIYYHIAILLLLILSLPVTLQILNTKYTVYYKNWVGLSSSYYMYTYMFLFEVISTPQPLLITPY